MHDLENYLLDKESEVSRHVMPMKDPPSKAHKDNSPTKTIPKTGGVQPYVDVGSQEPPTSTTKKEAQYYALPSLGRYPLDSYASVKQASAYFDEWGNSMSPTHRREYCKNLVKRASQLGIKVSDRTQKYGADGYAPSPEIDVALDGRRNLLKEAHHIDLLERVRSSRASYALAPDDFAMLLGEFDKTAGLNGHYDTHIPDPYYSTFGKSAESKMKESPEGSIVVGNDYLSRGALKEYALTNRKVVSSVFGDDFAEEFRKDPEAIFNSLPMDQKKLLMRMVIDRNAGSI